MKRLHPKLSYATSPPLCLVLVLGGGTAYPATPGGPA
jgi:hypothetical protein